MIRGFTDTSEAWEASLALALVRADAQYGDLARRGQEYVAQSGRGQGLGKILYPRPVYGWPQQGAGYGGGQGPRPNPIGQRPEGDRFGYEGEYGQARRYNACLKRGHKSFARECAVTRGGSFVQFHRAIPTLSPQEHDWASDWRARRAVLGLLRGT